MGFKMKAPSNAFRPVDISHLEHFKGTVKVSRRVRGPVLIYALMMLDDMASKHKEYERIAVKIDYRGGQVRLSLEGSFSLDALEIFE